MSSAQPSRWREYGLPAVLLTVSLVTTTAIGARYMQNFLDGLPTIASDADLWPWPWLVANPARFLLGIPFSASLLGILLAHEFGHYFACRAHGIRCTLPWVLPAPTLSGTAGAVIQIRGQIPSRPALMDVGAYGPIAGYAASLLVLAKGFQLSGVASAEALGPQQVIQFGQPLTLPLLHRLLVHFLPGAPTFEIANRHPVLIAGWIGLFITALNLLPGGQLDGGHILYAISPRLHRTVTRLLPFVLILAGIVSWLGWIVWAAILFIPTMRHPRVPIHKPLRPQHYLLCAVTLVIVVLCFAAQPFAGNSLLHYLHLPGWLTLPD
jgi:membrane-associated protease RseP (regulator of RpoE activity)